MKNLIYILFLGLLSNCSEKKEKIIYKNKNLNKPYIISFEKKKQREKLDSLKIPLPYEPNGVSIESNLLIDINGDIYYYGQEKKIAYCGTGLKNETIPKFINLQPKDILKLPKNCIEQFINENVMIKNKNSQILVISSQRDTINDKLFLKFLYQIKIPTYIIRLSTQEEDTVLHYKMTNQYYNFNLIKWDEKRILFDKFIRNY